MSIKWSIQTKGTLLIHFSTELNLGEKVVTSAQFGYHKYQTILQSLIQLLLFFQVNNGHQQESSKSSCQRPVPSLTIYMKERVLISQTVYSGRSILVIFTHRITAENIRQANLFVGPTYRSHKFSLPFSNFLQTSDFCTNIFERNKSFVPHKNFCIAYSIPIRYVQIKFQRSL